MARGFGSTYGVGSSDEIGTTFSTAVTIRSYFVWYVYHGSGGGGLGRLWSMTAGSDALFVDDSDHTAGFDRNFATFGEWRITLPIAGTAWHSLGLSFDGSSTSNVPVMYSDGASQSVTTTLTPTGTIDNTAGNYSIGNRASDHIRAWDGKLADFAMWNAILTAAEFAALAKGARPWTIRKGSLVAWWPLDGNVSPEPDLSGAKNNGTLTGTAKAFGPPFRMVTPRWPQFTGLPSAPPEILMPAIQL